MLIHIPLNIETLDARGAVSLVLYIVVRFFVSSLRFRKLLNRLSSPFYGTFTSHSSKDSFRFRFVFGLFTANLRFPSPYNSVNNVLIWSYSQVRLSVPRHSSIFVINVMLIIYIIIYLTLYLWYQEVKDKAMNEIINMPFDSSIIRDLWIFILLK